MATTVASSPPALRFADSFWDANDLGVNVMLDKLHTAKQTCEEIKKLFEIRSQIEEDYGERLLKLSQTAVGQTEQGTTLAESLAQIPNSLETSGRAHLDLAQQLKDHLEAPLDGFLREQRDLRRMHHQQIENARQLKNMHHTNAVKAKEFYHTGCERVSATEKTMRELGSEMSADQRKKMEFEISEGRKMIQVAEKEYRRAVDVLNGVTQDWINSWKSTCNVFQEMEERRIRYIHGSLRSFASMLSSVCLVDEQCYERISSTLELTDIRRDMDAFSLRYGTGTEMPGMIQFEPYVFEEYEEGDDPSAQVTPASSVHEAETQEPPKPDGGDRDKETRAVDAAATAAPSVPAPVALAAAATSTEDHTQSASVSPGDETPAPTTPPSFTSGGHDVKKPDQNDHALLTVESKSSIAMQADTKNQQVSQATSSPGPEQQQQQEKEKEQEQQQQQEQAVSLPPRDERWVISSMRRPQQLPVRAQNVRMSTVAPTPPPPLSTPLNPTSTPPVSAPSTPSVNHKFHRPNAPVKIEIPEKPTTVRNSSAPAAALLRRHDSLRQQAMDNNANSSDNNRNIKHIPAVDSMETSSDDVYAVSAPTGANVMDPAENVSAPTTRAATTSPTTGKKGQLSSFVKNMLKQESNSKDTKRFSMNFFGSSSNKKEAAKHMSLDEVFYHSDMVSNSNSSQTNHAPSHSSMQLEDGSQVIEYVRAVWSFDARIPNEMSFVEGDTMAVLYKQMDGWWLVELADPTRRQRGLVPGNYMQSM